jgi:uncharacterized protein with ParB-like and HNH nuclease domain
LHQNVKEKALEVVHEPENVANFYKTHFIKFRHWQKDEGHTLFYVQFLANQLVILCLLKFQILLTLYPFFPSLSPA